MYNACYIILYNFVFSILSFVISKVFYSYLCYSNIPILCLYAHCKRPRGPYVANKINVCRPMYVYM